MRFPELYRLLALRGAEILAVPAAFTLQTGKDHWELLLRARAVENQAFVVAPAQWGQKADGRWTYGRSMIVDPWGTVLATCPDRDGTPWRRSTLTSSTASAPSSRRSLTAAPKPTTGNLSRSALADAQSDEAQDRDADGHGRQRRLVMSPSRPSSPVAVAARITRCGASRLAWLPDTFCAAAVRGSETPRSRAASIWSGMNSALDAAFDPVSHPPSAPITGATAG